MVFGGPSIPTPRPPRGRQTAGPAQAYLRDYRSASDDLLDALTLADALHRLVTISMGSTASTRSLMSTPDLGVVIGPVSGSVALHPRIVESLVHSWDLAQATGQRPEFPDDLTEQALGFIIGRLIVHPEARAAFGPSQTAGAYAPAIERLAACLGRDVN